MLVRSLAYFVPCVRLENQTSFGDSTKESRGVGTVGADKLSHL